MSDGSEAPPLLPQQEPHEPDVVPLDDPNVPESLVPIPGVASPAPPAETPTAVLLELNGPEHPAPFADVVRPMLARLRLMAPSPRLQQAIGALEKLVAPDKETP